MISNQPNRQNANSSIGRRSLDLSDNLAAAHHREDGFSAVGRFFGRLWRFLQPWKRRLSEG